jgi:hypothetical protein
MKMLDKGNRSRPNSYSAAQEQQGILWVSAHGEILSS